MTSMVLFFLMLCCHIKTLLKATEIINGAIMSVFPVSDSEGFLKYHHNHGNTAKDFSNFHWSVLKKKKVVDVRR